MSRNCSRKDHILALAISKTPSQSTISLNIPTERGVNTVRQKTAKPIHYTDIKKLWSRAYDFNDFPSIVGNKKEYEDSFSFIQYDLKKMQSMLREETNITNYKNQQTEAFNAIPQVESSNKDAISQQTELINTIGIHTIPQQIESTNTIEIDATSQEIHNDASLLKTACTNKNKSMRSNLKCYERMPPSDEEENLLATRHDLFENSDDSVKDKNYEPNSSDADSDCLNTQFASNQVRVVAVDVYKAQTEDTNFIDSQWCSSPPACSAPEVLPHESNIIDTEKGFTKAGVPRKRRRFEEPLSERVKQKKERDIEKLSLKPPCGDTCRKKCSTKFTAEIRTDIHRRYINLNWEGRGLFIKGFVKPEEVKVRTAGKGNEKRQTTNKYYFNNNIERIEVCKKFFLTTLGYNPTNDRHLHFALKNPVDEQQDKRGKYERQHVIDKDIIKEHILSFRPSISHYRRGPRACPE
ncbi:Uncharacterized protein OBRU01_10980 [Operophtera brumata]|uniref:Uncharacterized protein n=1 Tax=Operophtera brumata TaxID=104452 RepID=A0A0L7LCV4_OPEBR|nr:Uncharacterized protein OBRU01_21726 [Operophtera brumata]KOB73225.1 Uncharacterized protein OBRU01_10980 [Operophtera brumata]